MDINEIYKGLLAGPTDEDKGKALNMGLLTAGLGLLGRKNIGEAGLLGVGQYQQAMRQGQEDRRNKLQQAGLLMQMQKMARENRMEEEKSNFFSPQGQAQFMTGGKPEIPMPPAEVGGGPSRAAVPPSLDLDKMMAAAASRNFIPPETYLNHRTQREHARAQLQATQQSRLDNLMQRDLELQERIRRNEAMEQRDAERDRQHAELMRESLQTRREIAAANLASRPPRNTQYVNTAQGVMRDEGGRLVPVLGDDGKPLMPHAGFATSNNQALSLAREYGNAPSVKTYNTVAPAVTQTAQYVASIPKTGSTAADDAALTKLYISLTHPHGDQISNRDMRELAMQPDLPDRVKASISGFISGRKLPDATRAEFWGVINNRFKSLDGERQKKRAEVESRAKEMGLNPNAIFGTE